MKRLFQAILASALLMFASCDKEFDTNNEDPAYVAKTIEYSIVANAPGYSASETKGGLGIVARVYWDSSDKIKVYQVNDNTIRPLDQNILTVQEGSLSDDYSKVTFTGTISEPSDGSTLLFVYAANPNDINLDTEKNRLSYSLNNREIIKTETNAIRVPYVAYATAEYASTSVAIKSAEFKLATSYVNAIVMDSNLANKTISSISIYNVSNKVELNANGVVTCDDATATSLIFSGLSFQCNAEGSTMIGFAVPASVEVTSREITFGTTGGDSYHTAFSKNRLSAGSFYSTGIKSLKKITTIGCFSIAENRQIAFAPGNLQAELNGSGEVTEWKFAENQYKIIGEGGANKTFKDGDFDFFGWSSDGTGATAGYKEWGINSSETLSDYHGDFKDWGENIDLINDLAPHWFTMSSEHFNYLLGLSTPNRGYTNLFALARLNNVDGLLIFPDNYNDNIEVTGIDGIAKVNATNVHYTVSSIPADTWNTMESAGCVFLPAAGVRDGSNTLAINETLYYWSSSPANNDGIDTGNYIKDFAYHYYLLPPAFHKVTPEYRFHGYPVRLVREYK